MKRNPRKLCGMVCWIVSFAMLASALAAEGGYHLIKKIPIAGDAGWDYVAADSQGRRLYVSHGTELIVLDLDSGAVVGKIKGGDDTHGAAIARELGRGFISASDPGSVTIFDLKTLAVIDKVRVGDDPNGIIYDRKTKRVFTADRGSKRLTAIDAMTGKIVATSENLGGRTEHLASDEAGHIFLNMQSLNTLAEIRCANAETAGDLAHGSLRNAQQHGYGPRSRACIHRMPQRRHGRGGRKHGKGDCDATDGQGRGRL